MNNFTVTHTYRDSGKSGLVLKKRQGLCKLLNDVIQGNSPYKAILVYDVSRWGRFQWTGAMMSSSQRVAPTLPSWQMQPLALADALLVYIQPDVIHMSFEEPKEG